MNTAIQPRCGLTDIGMDEQELADAGIWAEEFVRLYERRHLKDLRTHTCPHWVEAMQDAAEAQECNW